MIKRISKITLIFHFFTTLSYGQMRTLDDLIDSVDPGWPFVKQWIDSAKNRVEILPANIENAKRALHETQVTTRSPMGAIIYATGGLLIDDGWIRILGSGSERLTRSLPDWNRGKSFADFGQPASYLLIADDVLGGFFLLNGGGLGDDLGKVYYFAPDNLEFEPLGLTYTEFLLFCFNNNLDDFYEGHRWSNWRDEVLKLDGDKVFNFVPCLWSRECKDISKHSKRIVSVEEQFNLNLDFRRKLGIDK